MCSVRPLLRLQTTLQTHYLRLEIELYTQQLLHYQLCHIFLILVGLRSSSRNRRLLTRKMHNSLTIVVDASKIQHLLLTIKVKQYLRQFLSAAYLFKQLLTVVLKTAITYKGLLNRCVVICVKFANGKRYIFMPRGRAHSIMQLYVQSAYSGLQMTDSIFLLLDHDSEIGNLLLHSANLSRILLILFLQLSQQVRSLLLQIVQHEFLLLLRINHQILLPSGLYRLYQVMMIVRHPAQLYLNLSSLVSHGQKSVPHLLLSLGLFFEQRQAHLDRRIVFSVVRDELELVPLHSQCLNLAVFSFQSQLHLLSDSFRCRIVRQILLRQSVDGNNFGASNAR